MITIMRHLNQVNGKMARKCPENEAHKYVQSVDLLLIYFPLCSKNGFTFFFSSVSLMKFGGK